MLFTPIIIACLVADPLQCTPYMGFTEETEAACMESLNAGLDFVANNRPNLYVAGLACIETHTLDESANNQ